MYSASPLVPSGQVQTAMCRRGLHTALGPHSLPVHGFWQVKSMQALLSGHSLSVKHSPRWQLTSALPMYPVGQVHTGLSFPVLSCPGVHIAPVPQGFGSQISRPSSMQLKKGLPVMWLGQLQTGVMPLRLQSAFTPHTPSQGFMHFW